MYLLHGDVIWALRRGSPRPSEEPLFDWAAEQMPSTLFASVITIMEFQNGARLLERKDKASAAAIHKWIETRLRPAFEGRILAIDDAVVRRWADLGYSDFRDGMLAATALQHGLAIATRHADRFRTARVKTVNPWSYTREAEELDWRRASRTAPIWLKNLFVRA